MARQAIWARLALQMEERTPRRKAMKGFPDFINVGATLAASSPAKKPTHSIPAALWRQLHLAVVSGAVVAGDRMHAMKHVESDDCALDSRLVQLWEELWQRGLL